MVNYICTIEKLIDNEEKIRFNFIIKDEAETLVLDTTLGEVQKDFCEDEADVELFLTEQLEEMNITPTNFVWSS